MRWTPPPLRHIALPLLCTLPIGLHAQARLDFAQLYPSPNVITEEEVEAPSPQDSPGRMIIRIDRLERQIRELNGQMEQLQYAQKRMEERWNKMQMSTSLPLAPSQPEASSPTSKPSGKERGDAFDPDTHPQAPGAPRNLIVLPQEPASPNGQANPLGARGMGAPPPAPSGPRADFDTALVAYKAGQYPVAQTGFMEFLQKNPKDPLVSEAIFYLGESYFKGGQYREAAEQYLKFSTNYEKSTRAPEALYQLGLSLEKLGAKDQACSALGEITRKYPNASPSLRGNADKNMKRLKC